MIQPVRNQKNHLVLCVGAQIFKYYILRFAIQRGKRIIQNQYRPRVRQRSRQRQPLRLSAG